MSVPGETRERILECSDLDLLDSWLQRAVTVGRVEAIFLGE